MDTSTLVLQPKGRFGPYGGQFVPETLMPALHELEEAYDEARQDPNFVGILSELQRTYVGGLLRSPSPDD